MKHLPERRAGERVHLAEPEAEWAVRFERERAAIAAGLGETLTAIEHVGSTSIPRIRAKPIVDIAATIRSFVEFPVCLASLEELGYLYVPEFEVELPNRRYLRKGEVPGARLVHLHLYEDGHPEFGEYLLFRDHLRAHPEVAREYEALKIDLAARLDRPSYTAAKAPFVRQVIERAQS